AHLTPLFTKEGSGEVYSNALSPTIFQTPSYLIAYRRYFGAGKKFHRLRVGEGAAFLMTRGHAARRLEWWGAGIHDIGGASYGSPCAAQELWKAIETLTRQHQGAQLAQMPASCQLVALAAHAGWHVTDAEACPVLTLPATWDEYVRSLGKNMREQIKRYPKRLEKQFAVQYELAQDEAAVQRALTDLFRLHGKRWRARGQTGVLATPRRQKFHRAVCAAFLRQDWLRLWTLRCDGEAACVLLNYFYGGRYYFFIGGFEPELMRWSVGTCLFAKAIQHAIEEDATEFDFLRGEEEYKYRLGAINRAYKTISWFQDSPRGRLLQRRIELENAFMYRMHQMFSAAHRTG
ncbi:MAG: GNAT family N-acetyltransferase, partial [Armatimonadota bacterium]|nr:GNAT family N-acetyltransferase [Armatimonadota bacterium]